VRSVKRLAAITAVVVFGGLSGGVGGAPAAAVQPPTPYPRIPPGTAFLNHAALLGNVQDPAWFQTNIPFLEVPDQQIQSVYYYRWQTYKEHLVYTGPEYGWLSNEFLQPVGYGAPYGGVVAAAGHQITEGRWLCDQQYVKDDVNYWLAGPGQFPKPQNDGVNADTSDWAHEYSFWAASSVWQQYLATGDRAFAIAEEANLVKQYRGWDNHFNSTLGLYWQVPVWDATEFTPASYESGDPYHGGAGYRPTINAYQYGDARAIASIATLSGDTATANEYTNRANALRAAVQAHLWDSSRNFFFHMARDNNPSNALLDTREEEGFVPWMFDMPQASDNVALAQLLDPQGFAATYGPTTAERRSRWFNYQAAGCCHWDGPSWPYETSQTLTGVANALEDYPAQSTITAANYLNLLHSYAATQYRNGVPYVAEAHDPDTNTWIYDSYGHSEDYNHSTYNDNVISGLIGLRGQPGNTLVVKPLAPPTWDYFALENTPYHGHNVSVLWDRTGGRYGQGAGLHIYVDGSQVASQANLGAVTVNIGAPLTQSNGGGTVDIAANGQRFASKAQPFASYTFGGGNDSVWNPVDGIVYGTGIPQNSRWTSYATSNASDYYGVNFGRNQRISDVRLYFYDDGGGVRTPTSYDLQYWSGSAWATISGQNRSPAAATGNAANLITFPPVTTSQLRVVAPNAGGGTGWGLSEFQAWAAPVFQIVNVNSVKMLAVANGSQANSANVQQYHDNGSTDHLWELVDAGAGWYKIVNVNSGLLLAVQGASTALSAQIQQDQDNGTSDQLWRLVDNGGGQFKIVNKNSGQLLGVSNMSQDDSANVVQFSDNGTLDHLWTLQSAGTAQTFNDDFEAGNANQWTPQSGNWSLCHPSSYEYCSNSTADSVSLAGDPSARVYTMDASVLANSAPNNSGIALLARAQDGTHYYEAELKKNGSGNQLWTISKNDGGVWTLLACGSYAWPVGSYTNIRLSVQGNSLTMGVWQPGGTWLTLGTGHDNQFVSGRLGVRTWGLTGSFDIVHAYAG
jgi:hypothetical protein